MSVIRNCSWGYKCKATWTDLSLTSNESSRFCSDCEREVYRCETPAELLQAIALNRCVNFPWSLVDATNLDEQDIDRTEKRLTGMPLIDAKEFRKWEQIDDENEIPF